MGPIQEMETVQRYIRSALPALFFSQRSVYQLRGVLIKYFQGLMAVTSVHGKENDFFFKPAWGCLARAFLTFYLATDLEDQNSVM